VSLITDAGIALCKMYCCPCVYVCMYVCMYQGTKVRQRYRPGRPIGLREVKAPTLLRQTANRWRQGCQPYAPAALYLQVSLFLKIPGTHFC
jgi:hypothetical protein